MFRSKTRKMSYNRIGINCRSTLIFAHQRNYEIRHFLFKNQQESRLAGYRIANLLINWQHFNYFNAVRETKCLEIASEYANRFRIQKMKIALCSNRRLMPILLLSLHQLPTLQPLFVALIFHLSDLIFQRQFGKPNEMQYIANIIG